MCSCLILVNITDICSACTASKTMWNVFSFYSDALANLVGQQNARYGIIKIFNALQEASANKHLLYVSKTYPTGPASCHQISFIWPVVLLSLLGVDGNVTQGTVSWTQSRGGQHLTTHAHTPNTHRVVGWNWGAARSSFWLFCSWPIANCQARRGESPSVKLLTDESRAGRSWDPRAGV